jgi:hypothetical protein
MESADRPRRLNFGCGYDKRPGFLNVDMDPACQPDVLLFDNDLRVLGTGAFDEIVAKDVLEHVPRVQTTAILLEWADLLVDGGVLKLQTSSLEGIAAHLVGNPSFREHYNWTHCLFGTQAQPGDFHLTGFTDMSLTVHLIASGYRVDRLWVSDRWLLNAEATKVDSWTRLAEDRALDDDAFIRTMYEQVLFREPDEGAIAYFRERLGGGSIDRRAALKHVYTSPERLFALAERHGFEQAPSAISGLTAERVVRHIPDSWKPALRSMRSSARTATSRGRRAIGSLRARRVGH